MAEGVQFQLERQLPELEQMVHCGLFTKQETSAIVRKRKQFEYKVHRREKSKQDYLQVHFHVDTVAVRLAMKNSKCLLIRQRQKHTIQRSTNKYQINYTDELSSNDNRQLTPYEMRY